MEEEKSSSLLPRTGLVYLHTLYPTEVNVRPLPQGEEDNMLNRSIINVNDGIYGSINSGLSSFACVALIPVAIALTLRDIAFFFWYMDLRYLSSACQMIPYEVITSAIIFIFFAICVLYLLIWIVILLLVYVLGIIGNFLSLAEEKK